MKPRWLGALLRPPVPALTPSTFRTTIKCVKCGRQHTMATRGPDDPVRQRLCDVCLSGPALTGGTASSVWPFTLVLS